MSHFSSNYERCSVSRKEQVSRLSVLGPVITDMPKHIDKDLNMYIRCHEPIYNMFIKHVQPNNILMVAMLKRHVITLNKYKLC